MRAGRATGDTEVVTVPGGGHRNSWVDSQIRSAQERGEFDNLPGKGKPLKGIDGPPDDLWWVKQLMAREKLSYLPPGLALRLEVERFNEGLAKVPSERAVRAAAEELNERIRDLNRKPVMEGPPSTLMPLDVEDIVNRWRAARPARPASTSPEPQPDVVGRTGRRWRLRHRSA